MDISQEQSKLMVEDRIHRTQSHPVFISGCRSAFVHSFGAFEDCDALEILSRVTDGLLKRARIGPVRISEIIAGTVIPQTKNPNIARDTILNLGLPTSIPGYTLNNSCLSGLQCVINGAAAIKAKASGFVVAAGVESLSDVPVVYSKEAGKFLLRLSKSKSTAAKLNIIKHFRAKAWLPRQPEIIEQQTGFSMGSHAEIMAKKNQISRKEQDDWAMESHRRAALARKEGYFAHEIIPLWPSPDYAGPVREDNIIREGGSREDFARHKPLFDKRYGSVTAANSAPLTDGAAACLLADEFQARESGFRPSLRILAWDSVAVDPWDQPLIGQAVSIQRLLEKTALGLADIDCFEIHEAFAAQLLSCIRAMDSAAFCEQHFGHSRAAGAPDLEKINVNGGAIALGHPFGATGIRMLISMDQQLKRRNLQFGVISVCSAGGLAGSLLVERIPE